VSVDEDETLNELLPFIWIFYLLRKHEAVEKKAGGTSSLSTFMLLEVTFPSHSLLGPAI
jgi:hypothetical protein